VTATAGQVLASGEFFTDDEWRVRFDRVLVVLGSVALEGDDCEEYSESGYNRILDALRTERQRISRGFGLGACEFTFALSPPAWDTIRGEGIGDAEDELLRTRDPSGVSDAGVSVWVEGSAERSGAIKRFAWGFRRLVEYTRCALPGAEPEEGILFEAERLVAVDLELDGAGLFRTDAGSLFEPFRAADDQYGDADGVVTLEELTASPPSGGSSEMEPVFASFGEYLAIDALPRIVRYRGEGTCRTTSSPEDEDDFGG